MNSKFKKINIIIFSVKLGLGRYLFLGEIIESTVDFSDVKNQIIKGDGETWVGTNSIADTLLNYSTLLSESSGDNIELMQTTKRDELLSNYGGIFQRSYPIVPSFYNELFRNGQYGAFDSVYNKYDKFMTVYTAVENILVTFAKTNTNDNNLEIYSNYASQFLEFGKSIKSKAKLVTKREIPSGPESGSIYFLIMISYIGNAILSIVICVISRKEKNNQLTPKQSVGFAVGLIIAETVFFGISILLWRVPYVYPEYNAKTKRTLSFLKEDSSDSFLKMFDNCMFGSDNIFNAIVPSNEDGENEFTLIEKYASIVKEFMDNDDDDFEADSYEQFNSKIRELLNTDIRSIRNEDGSSLSNVVSIIEDNNCGSVQFSSDYRKISSLSCDGEISKCTYECDYLKKIKTFFDALHKAQDNSFPSKYLETIEELTEQLDKIEKLLDKIEKIISLFDKNKFTCGSGIGSNYRKITSSAYKHSSIEDDMDGVEATLSGNSSTSVASFQSLLSCVLIFSGVMSIQYSQPLPEPTNPPGDMAIRGNNNDDDQHGDIAIRGNYNNDDHPGDIAIKGNNNDNHPGDIAIKGNNNYQPGDIAIRGNNNYQPGDMAIRSNFTTEEQLLLVNNNRETNILNSNRQEANDKITNVDKENEGVSVKDDNQN